MLASRKRAFLGLGQAERVVRAQRADLERLDRVLQVIDRAGRAGEVQDVVDGPVDLQRLRDVVPDEAGIAVATRAAEVRLLAGDEVIDGDDLVALGEEALAQMRADEAGAAGDQRSHGACPPDCDDDVIAELQPPVAAARAGDPTDRGDARQGLSVTNPNFDEPPCRPPHKQNMWTIFRLDSAISM